MGQESVKCVMVVDEQLPLGVAANTAAILGITLGKCLPEAVGEDVCDASGCRHMGIITVPVPILRADAEKLKELRAQLFQPDFRCLTTVDFSDVAQGCQAYPDYLEKASKTPQEAHTYLGLAIYGDKKKVNKLTGSMPLLR